MAQSLYDCTQSECNVWQEKCKNETKEVKIERNEENNQTLLPSTQHQLGRDIANLAKCYTEDLKYSGVSDDNFEDKIDIFMEMCNRFGMAHVSLVFAFPTMLKAMALSFYFNRCRGKSISELCQAMKDNFEGLEYQRYNLQKWNNITFQFIINQNSTKSGMELITILINKLDKMQKALSSEFRTEKALHNKIITACKDVKACKIACHRPSPTVQGLIRDLLSGIEIFNRLLPTSNLLLQQNTSLASDEDGTFLIDRRYYNNRMPRNYGLVKRNDHKSKNEREEHRRIFLNKSNNKAELYISEYEGEHEVKESDDDMDMQAYTTQKC
ncbi:hypothetical protein EPUL_005225 [Erysiphe pulchra]|uniref:Uncharacterized protein n=1 Tax=Erysiphe pulchra TaxID=225359 RepID=A0A2S4PUW9_9PEZI|nr:hypothetical protein EPUL_005225 [Erysiphe pulchra]